MFSFRRVVCVLGAVLLAAPMLFVPGAMADIQQDFTISGASLTVINMIGHIDVVPASGTDYTISVQVKGDDAAEDVLKFNQSRDGDPTFLIQFPIEEHRDYVYPELGRNGRTTITYREDKPQQESWLKRIIAGVTCKRVTVRGRGDGLEIWADLTIGVPVGATLKVVDRVGEISARDIDGDLDLDTSSGDIVVRDIRGDLVADTGSGSVEVSRVTGEVLIDTGSGSVSVDTVEGPRVDADTVSGSVDLQGINAGKIHVDTGSGSVRVDQAKCSKLAIDTGSGGVTARGISADRAFIDTGSGSVEFVLVHLGKGRFEVDTGSGSINLILPLDASARINAETSSGGVRCQVKGAKILRKERNEMEVVMGNGDAKISLDAGSGTITIATH